MKWFKKPALVFWLFVSLVLGTIWNGMPLLETLGYEYALFSALLSALAAGHLGVLYPQGAQIRGEAPGLISVYFKILRQAYLIPLLLLVLSLLNGIRNPFCNVFEGLGFYVLMPIFGVAAASAMGLAIGLATHKKVKGTALWFVLFLVSIATGFYRFYASPAVYLFHPFAGYYPGVLYDRLIQIDGRLISYRAATLVHTAAILFAVAALYDAKNVRLAPKRFKWRSSRFYLAVFAVAVSGLLQFFGPRFGHQTLRDDLIRALPHHVATEHLDLYFPLETSAEMRRALTDDARFSLHQVATYLGMEITNRIAVFFFLDSAHKGRLIGAADTNVAKPWRREVYVVLSTPPHPVLRHELVHAVSADFGTGPFKIAGSFGGLVPNPALIEGLATAGGGMRGDLTVDQWAAAMIKLDMMPPLEKLFGLGFFDVPASAAYTAAGSFCRFVREEYGAKALRDAYRFADFQKSTGKTPADLAIAWRRHLENIPLTAADLAAAEHRFDRTPVIRTTCVHEVAKTCKEARSYIGIGAYDVGLARFEAAHEKSGHATATYRHLFWTAVAARDEEKQRRMAEHISTGAAFTRADKDAAIEVIVDLDRESGKPGDYAMQYSKLAETAGSASRERRLLVKAYLAARSGGLWSRLLDLFGPRPDTSSAGVIAGALTIAEAASKYPADPVLSYLLARQYFNAEAYQAVLTCLDSATGLEEVLPLIHTEAQFLRGKSLYFLHRFDDAIRVFESVAENATVREGLRERARDWAARTAFIRHVSVP